MTDREWYSDPERLLTQLRGSMDEGALPYVAGYELLSELARGGQGVVYLATQQSTRRRVALKILLERGFASATARRRFEREIELLASLDDPGIVKVFDSGVTDDGRLYLVMEFVDGIALDRYARDLRAKHPAADVTPLVTIIAVVAEAVNVAHRRGVIHRDLKPSNILVDAEGRPRVVDFGLARALLSDERGSTGDLGLSVAGQFMGSVPWSSPEQASGTLNGADVRSDVYSLGVILFQTLTDEFPYDVEGSLATALRSITESDPTRPSSRRRDIPRDMARDLDAIVMTCLAKNPERRYATAADLAADLRALAAGEPIRARRDTAWQGMTRRLRRYRMIAAISSVSAALVLALAVVALVQSFRFSSERDRAERRFSEARDLAHRFIFDFHEQIVTLPGSRPAREMMVTTALNYLRGVEAEAGDDPSFRTELAATYERVAQMQGDPTLPNLGKTAEAIESLNSALALRQAALATKPDDPELLRAAARVLDMRGLIEGQAGKNKEAVETLRQAETLLARARALKPNDPMILRESCANRDRLSDSLSWLEDHDGAIAAIMEGIDLFSTSPNFEKERRTAAILNGKASFLLRGVNRFEEANAKSTRAVELLRQVAAEDPGNAMHRRLLSVNLNELSESQRTLEQYDAARKTLEESLDIARSLYAADPLNPVSAGDLAFTLNKLGSLAFAQSDFATARTRFLDALELRRDVVTRDEKNAMNRRGLGVSLGMVAEAAEKDGQRPDAAPELRRERLQEAARLYRESAEVLDAMKADGVLLVGDADEASKCRTAADACEKALNEANQ